MSDNLTSIGRFAFDDCNSLNSITIPNSVTIIRENAFSACDNLYSVKLSENLTKIDDFTFFNCKNLTHITIPNSVSVIGANAFYGCSGLTNISIPNSVTSIDERSFADCTGLTAITIPDSVTKISASVFSGCSNLTNISIGNNVTVIESNTFKECGKLKNVKIPNSVVQINISAFQDCKGLESITIPASVTDIGRYAFIGCNNLKTVYCYRGSKADNANLYNSGTKLVYLNAKEKPSAPKFAVKGVFGGRNVTFTSATSGAKIYYSTTTSDITTSDKCVDNGSTVLFENYYGSLYVKAYYDGEWSDVSRLILKIPVVNKPTITVKGNNVNIKTTTPSCHIYYTTDGTTPSLTNGKRVTSSNANITVPNGNVVKAIAVRSCFTNSEVVSANVGAVSGSVSPVKFGVKGVFGGRNVTFTSDTAGAKIYYSTTTSKITTSDKSVNNGDTVLFENYYGTVYAKAYYNGKWSNVSRLILKIPVVNTPTITANGGKINIKTTTPSCYIYYTTDGTTPSLTNGKRIAASSTNITVPAGKTVKAIAVRSCFTNSAVATYKA